MENDGLLNDGARMFQGQVRARAARAGAPRREHGLVGARFVRARSNLDARAAFFRDRAARARRQMWVYFVTWWAYAANHITRKCYTNVKNVMKLKGLGLDVVGRMDAGFMFT